MGSGIERTIKWLAVSILPQPILYNLWHLRRKSRPITGDDIVEEPRTIPVQSGARLVVFWNTNRLGPGPSVSLFVLDEEIFRIDCFGGKTGHMHINPVQANLVLGWEITPRFFLPPGTMEEQVERAAFELSRNTVAALQINQLARIRNFSIEKKRLNEAINLMRSYMKEMMVKHGCCNRVDDSIPSGACSE